VSLFWGTTWQPWTLKSCMFFKTLFSCVFIFCFVYVFFFVVCSIIFCFLQFLLNVFVIAYIYIILSFAFCIIFKVND
jgi:hypothetical protein